MEQNPQPFNLTIFTKETQNMCLCTTLAIIIIMLFIISPLSNFFKTSLFMKIVSLRILAYILYLNYNQTELLRSASLVSQSEQVITQLNTNIICSYVFSLFIGLLIIFTFKSIITSVMSFFQI
jgi:ABC-type protease/lipase transport system fused ATPase/permease subunit